MSVLLSDSEIKNIKTTGQIEAYLNVISKMKTITSELNRKGLEPPKEFLVLTGYIEDRINELE